MVTMEQKDATAKKYAAIRYTVTKTGHRKSMSSFRSDVLYNITAIIVPCMGCTSNPTDRSEKAKLKNIAFSVAGIDAFNKARITRRFPRIATIQNIKLSTQRDNKK